MERCSEQMIFSFNFPENLVLLISKLYKYIKQKNLTNLNPLIEMLKMIFILIQTLCEKNNKAAQNFLDLDVLQYLYLLLTFNTNSNEKFNISTFNLLNDIFTCFFSFFPFRKTYNELDETSNEAKIKQDKNPDCIGCHTVGYRFESGYLDPNLSPDTMKPAHLGAVGCESCHGPGENHLKDHTVSMLATPTYCLNCHNPETSPKFDFKTYWKKIEHR